MHLNGLGNAKKDTRDAVGWLGVAADGQAPRDIEKVFAAVWERIPEDSQPGYQKLVDAFIARYGTKANDVVCRRVNSPGSKVRQTRCMLTDRNGSVLTDQMEDANRGGPSQFESLGGAPSGGPPG